MGVDIGIGTGVDANSFPTLLLTSESMGHRQVKSQPLKDGKLTMWRPRGDLDMASQHPEHS